MSKEKEFVFLSGIGGSGMSAIACLCLDRGMGVKGSDRAFDQSPDHPIAKALKTRGVELVPQDGSHPVLEDSLMVASAAVEDDRPEILTAKRLGLPIISRGEYLAELTREYRTLAVAGTSGKSTTSAMLAYVMGKLGLDPSFIGGGKLEQFKAEDNPGNYRKGESDILVVEACESDGHLAKYHAEHSIILNIGLDHMGLESTLGLFSALINNTSGSVIINGDDEGLTKTLTNDRTLSFSIKDTSADFLSEDVLLFPLGSRFVVNGTLFELQIPGVHNVYNALATIAALSLYGVTTKDIAPMIKGFRGIERRFDIHLNELGSGGPLVVDDYAHNPHKISFLMRSMKEIAPRVCYIFQPHGYGPTRLMRDEYVRVFKEFLRPGDKLVMLPIYFAGGTVSKDISSADLAIEVGLAAWAPESREQALDELPAGYGAYVVFGARDDTLSELASRMATKLRGRKV